jgi:hypothetical protein
MGAAKASTYIQINVRPPTSCYGASMNTVARALALARSGRFQNLTDLRKALRTEGLPDVDEHFAGPGFKAQLGKLVATARAASWLGITRLEWRQGRKERDESECTCPFDSLVRATGPRVGERCR